MTGKENEDLRSTPTPVSAAAGTASAPAGTASAPACLERQCAEAMQQIRLYLAQYRDSEITESQALATLGAELSGLGLKMSVHATLCTC